MRRPEDQLADETLPVIGIMPGVIVIDLRKVGLFAPVYRDRKTGQTTYGAPVRIGEDGQPDFLILVDGLALGLEMKARDGRNRIEPNQHKAHAAWRSQGTPVAVARSTAEAVAAIEARRCS